MTRREFAGLLCCLPAAGKKESGYTEIRKMLDGRSLRIVPFSHVHWAWANSRAWTVRRHAIVSGGENAQAALTLPFHPSSVREIDFNGTPRPRKIALKGKLAQIEMNPWRS